MSVSKSSRKPIFHLSFQIFHFSFAGRVAGFDLEFSEWFGFCGSRRLTRHALPPVMTNEKSEIKNGKWLSS
jgi:hypothetical protein